MPKTRAKRLPEILTKEEARQLLAQPNRRYPTGLRNYTMMAVMYRAGLRVSEVLALEPSHIDAKRLHIRVVGGKGDKDRTIPVEPWLIEAIARWQEVRKGLPGNSRAVFVTLKGESLDDRYVRAMVKREAVATGITKDIHPHTLRHSYASELLEDGLTIREVQDLLGHADVSTTMIYTHVNPVHMAEKIRRRAF
jgi:integrase/recombinase XerD